MRWIRLAALAGFAGCQPLVCRGSTVTTLDEELPLPPVQYQVVSPCVYRYFGEPSEPGFPHPNVNGLAYPAFKVDYHQHLVMFTDCDPDAGMSGKIELFYVYTGAPPQF